MAVQGARPWKGFLYDVGRFFRRLFTFPHDYLSTACLHGQHARCRRACKFCGALCLCRCHGSLPTLIATPVPDDD